MNNPLGGSLRREAEAGVANEQVAETTLDAEVVDGVVKNTNTEVEGVKSGELAGMDKAEQDESADVVKMTRTEVAEVFSAPAENTANISSGEQAAEATGKAAGHEFVKTGEQAAEASTELKTGVERETSAEQLAEALLSPEQETKVQKQEYLDEDAEDRAVEDGTGWEHDIVMQNTEKLAKTAMRVVKNEVAGMTHPADLDYKRLKWLKELLSSAYNRKYPGRAA